MRENGGSSNVKRNRQHGSILIIYFDFFLHCRRQENVNNRSDFCQGNKFSMEDLMLLLKVDT